MVPAQQMRRNAPEHPSAFYSLPRNELNIRIAFDDVLILLNQGSI